MNISKRDQKLLLILLGLVIFIACWLGVHNSYQSKADGVLSEIAGLEPRLTELREHEAKLPEYQAGINAIAEDVTAELKKFPGDVRTEDMIMYGAGLEKALGIEVGSMAFMPAEMVSQFSIPVEGDEGIMLVPYAALRTGMSISCELDYGRMKKLINYIYSTPQRTTLESLSVSYNAETAGLTGSASLAKFFMSGQDYVYEATVIPNIKQGTNNPFGTTDKVAEIVESPSPSLSPLPSNNPTTSPKPSTTPSGGGEGSGSN